MTCLPRDIQLKVVSYMDIDTRRSLGIYARLKPLPCDFQNKLKCVLTSLKSWQAIGYSDRLQWRTFVELGCIGQEIPRYTIVKQKWYNEPYTIYMYHTYHVSQREELYSNVHHLVMETARMPLITSMIVVV